MSRQSISAAALGKTKALRALIDVGANIHTPGPDGSPINAARLERQTDAVKILQEAGAITFESLIQRIDSKLMDMHSRIRLAAESQKTILNYINASTKKLTQALAKRKEYLTLARLRT